MYCKYVEKGKAVKLRQPRVRRTERNATTTLLSDKMTAVWLCGMQCGKTPTKPVSALDEALMTKEARGERAESSTAGGNTV